MQPTRMASPAVATAAVVAALAVPAPAGAVVYDVFQNLAERRLSPAPLVPTTAPPLFLPLDVKMINSQSLRRGGYAVRLVHPNPGDTPRALIRIAGGDFRSLAAGLKSEKRLGFRARSTRVRGRRGYVLTRSLRPRIVELLWAENGVVYSVGTATTRRVSLKQLRSVAAGLDSLEREYIGSVYDQNLQTDRLSAVLISTKRTVSGHLEWTGECRAPDGSPTTPRAGSMDLTLVPRSGNAFSSPLRSLRDGWTGQVSGTVSPGAITLDLRATVNIGGDSCDTGQVSLVADKRAI
jgi:hypothetical protein